MPGSSSSSKKRQRSIQSNTSVTYFVSASEFREWLRASFKLSHRVISEPQTWWVMSAKKEETRLKRLAILIVDSEQNRRIAVVTGNVRR